MAGSRKPNPTHITRYESESHSSTDRQGKPWRSSHYDHGIRVPAEYRDEICLRGFVRVEETNAEYWGRRLDEQDTGRGSAWSDDWRRLVERKASEDGLHSVRTWTVGHVVWPGATDEPCRDCPYGSGQMVTLNKGEMILPREGNGCDDATCTHHAPEPDGTWPR